ncbi:T cell receptor delta constant [Chanodichthys erythropterus]|uniref:T cell receptor delta constant n=1 Tax=Chanodichthys erythropterus TaxID=933992 RepID=UPI00351F5B5E
MHLGQECFCKGYGSRAFSATDTLTFGKPITLTVTPKDATPTPPVLSILSPLDNKGQDICLAAGFFPRDKTMNLNTDGKELKTDNAVLFKSSKTYYYAGFNGGKIQKCKVDEVVEPTADVIPVTEKTKGSVALSCPTKDPNAHAPPEFLNSDKPKMNSMTLLVTGLRILLAKCVAVNVLMTVKAFLF